MKPSQPDACPCGSGCAYDLCCGRYHAGTPAPDAEALMRSRYTAYVRGDAAYLRATWHPDTRPQDLDLATPPQPQWRGLVVEAHAQTGSETATVRFAARYKLNGRAFTLRETSRFERVDGRWYYRDGDVS